MSLDLIRKRDPAILKKTFEEINPFLIKVLAANSIYSDTAEDLIHQTWERFFQNLDKFEGRSELRTFICGILINKIREHRRAIGRMDLEEDAEVVMQKTFSHNGWWSREPADPASLILSKQVANFIAECMEGLTHQQREAFILKELDHEDSSNICNTLGVSVSNLRVLIFRAKDKLRQCLAGKV